MTDNTAIRYNEWDEPSPIDESAFGEPIDMSKLPVSFPAGGMQCRIAWCLNEQAVVELGRERSYDHVQLDAEGKIQWVQVDDRFTGLPPYLAEMVDGQTGSYVEMARLADTLNAKAEKLPRRPFTFYPHPLETAGAR